MAQGVSSGVLVSGHDLLNDNYKMLKKIGHGSFGVVFSVTKISNNEPRAVKLVEITELKAMRELLMLAPENRHENIVPCYGAIVIAANTSEGEWKESIQGLLRGNCVGSFIMAMELELCQGIVNVVFSSIK